MNEDSLERLSTRIETKTGSELLERRPLKSTAPRVPHEFPKQVAPPTKPSSRSGLSLFEYVFFFSVVFFVLASTYAGLTFFSGDNTVSTKNVSLSIVGPTSVRAGDVMSFDIVITNRNTVAINNADLFIEYPVGTRSSEDVSKDLSRERVSLGTIESGKSITRTVKAVVFGTRGTPLNVKTYVTFRVPSSNATFRSDTNYSANISHAPVSLTVSTLREVVSGQPTDITVTVSSNATEPLTKIILVGVYPPGFQLQSSDPQSLSGNPVWNLGTIAPGTEKKVTLRGTFTGENGDDRVMHFTVGSHQEVNDTAITAPLAATDVALTVAKPFVGLKLTLNGSSAPELPIARGTPISGTLEWNNNLPVSIQDVEITLKNDGNILDKTSVSAANGFYRSVDSTLVFNKESDADLASVEPGASEKLTFTFAALPSSRGTFKASQITLSAAVRGNRIGESSVPEVITSSASMRAIVATELALDTALTASGGPVPPKVDTPTDYQITWNIANSANAVADTVLTATLPSYVVWRSSQNDAVTYNATTRAVTWKIGDMESSARKSASFTVSLTPSLSQLNRAPVLLNPPSLTAFDRFVRTAVDRTFTEVLTTTGTTPERGTVVP